MLSGVFLSPIASAPAANAETVGSGFCTQTVSSSSGVEVTRIDNDCIVQFKDVGTNSWTAPDGVSPVQVLVIGGGGGNGSGGGGAGGLYQSNNFPVTPGANIAVVVGAKGVDSPSGAFSQPGGNGSSSRFGNREAGGGGGGGRGLASGGGHDGQNAPSSATFTGTSFTRGSGGGGSSSGSSGGVGGAGFTVGGNTASSGEIGGGGGGAGGAGDTGQAGAGSGFDITGSNITYAAGAVPAGGTGTTLTTPGSGKQNGAVIVRFSLSKPDAVTGLQLTSPRYVDADTSHDQVSLSWDQAAAQTPAVTGYEIRYSNNSDMSTASTEVVSGISNTSKTITGLTDGDTYYFEVYAFNGEPAESDIRISDKASVVSRALSAEDFALDFDGGNTYLEGDHQVIPAGNDFTFETWLHPVTPLDFRTIVYQGAANEERFAIYYRNQEFIHIGRADEFVDVPVGDITSQWTHLAVTVDSSDLVSTYINGQLVLATTLTPDALPSASFMLGARESTNDGNRFDGLLDQVKVWDAPLTQTQVEQSMHSWGATGVSSAPGLIAHYDFNDNTQSSVVRDMAGDHDLQVSGSPTLAPLVEADTTTKPDSVLYEFTRSYLTSEGGWTPPKTLEEAQLLVVGGGGGGGAWVGGGGGAGGFNDDTDFEITSTSTVPVKIGMGGRNGIYEGASGDRYNVNGLSYPNAHIATSGQSSQFGEITGLGGGRGGSHYQDGSDSSNGIDSDQAAPEDGGSGGGGSGRLSEAIDGGATLAGQGYQGGDGSSKAWIGGGGGGSETAGVTASSTHAGNGGNGTVWAITGERYAAGGGGGNFSFANTADRHGNGGLGGGGNGGITATDGQPNTGSGGGGAGSPAQTADSTGGRGGSGIVVLSYEVAVADVSITGNDSAFTTETVTFTADTTNSQGNLTYTWQKKLSGGSWVTVATSGTTYTTPALTLADDQSQYRVVVDSAINGTDDEDESNVITLSVSDIFDHYLVFSYNASDTASFDPVERPTDVNDLSNKNRDAQIVTNRGNAVTLEDQSFKFERSADSYIDIPDLPASIDFSGGFTVDFIADFGEVESWERIVDIGKGRASENLVVSRHAGDDHLMVQIYRGTEGQAGYEQNQVSFESAIQSGLTRYTVVADGTTVEIYINGTAFSGTKAVPNGSQARLLNNTDRTSNFVGRGNWSATEGLGGSLRHIRLFNKAFSSDLIDDLAVDYKTVQFDSQGGSSVDPMPTSGSLRLPAAPDRAGYNFTGWYLSDSKVGDPEDVYSPGSDLTLDAKWVIDPGRLLIDFDATDTGSFDRSDQSLSARNGDYSGTVTGDLTDGDNDRFNFDNSDRINIQTIPSSVDWSDGLTLDFTADLGSVNEWERVIDLGDGTSANRIIFGREDQTENLMLEVWDSSGNSHKVRFTNALNATNSPNGEHRYTLLYDGTNATLVIDGTNSISGTVTTAGDTLPPNVQRDSNFIGFANLGGTQLEGTIRDLKLYNAAYTTDDLSALATTFTTVDFKSETGDFSLETSGSLRLPDPGLNTGKQFDGWYSDAGLTSKLGDVGDIHTPGDTELFARWISDFTLQFYSEGVVVDTQTLSFDDTATPPTLSRLGYDLTGWHTDPSADSVVYQPNLSNFTMPANDQDLYAVWDATDYTLTFKNNGATFSTATFDVETTVTDPGKPTSIGDRFLGWSTDNDPSNIVSFPYQPAAGDLDLFAVYGVDYAAYFDGADPAHNPSSGNKDIDENRSPNDGSGQDKFTSGEGVIPGSGSFSWEAWIYPTGFNSNWSSILENADAGDNFGRVWLHMVSPDNQTNPTEAKLSAEYRATNQQGTSATSSSAVIKMNTWQHVAATYEISGGNLVVSIYLNGQLVGSSLPVSMTGNLSSAALRIGEAAWINQEFEGYIDQVKVWKNTVLTEQQVAESMESIDSINGINPTSYYNFDELGSTVSTGDTVEDQIGNFDLTANGSMSRHLNDYSVVYDANGGANAPVDSNLYSPFTSATVLAEGSIEQTNFSFTGWNTKDDGTGDPYAANDTVSMLYGDVTLFAQWNQDTFTVTINRGNFAGTGDITLTKTAGVDLTLPGDSTANNTFTREGHVVAGWSNDPQGDSKAYDFGDTYVDDEAGTLYPYWEKDFFDLTFDVDGTTTTQQVEFEAVPVFAGSAPTGYTISGWSDGTTTYAADLNDFSMPSNTVTLTATLTANLNTVTFKSNNGQSQTETQSITTDVETALDENSFIFDGYAFAGWEEEGNTSNTFADQQLVTINSDLTLVATWSAETYDIVFVYNGADSNNSPASTTYTTGQITDLELPDPVKAGHNFAGWYSDSGLNTFEGNAGDVFTTIENVTLYAKWTAIERTVTYSADAEINVQNVTASGTVPVDDETYVIGENVPVSANSGSTGDPLSVNHYSFVGWTDELDGSGELVQPGESFSMGDGNVTLYAKWEPVIYTINYLTNGAAGTPSRTSDTRTVENAVINPLPTVGDMVKVGYELAGWATDPDATAAEVVSFISVDKNANYYAIWELKTINYSFSAGVANGTNLDSETLTGFPDGGSADYATTINIPNTLQSTLDLDNNSVVDNYLTGWSYDGKVYQPGESFILGEQDPVFTAVWAPLRQVRYSTNGGTHTDPAGEFDELCVMEDNTCTVGLEITLHDEPTRAGYNFLHWEDQKSGTLDAGDKFTVQDDNYLLFAKWEAIQYTFAFANSFKVGGQPNITASIGQTIQLPAAIDRTGYSFGGWENGGIVYGEQTDFIVGTEGLLFTAIWIPDVYTITFDWQGGTGTANPTDTYTVGTGPMTLPATGNVKDGFVFGGWSETEEGSAVSDYQPTESRVLYAVWDSGFYETTFDAFGGTVTNTVVQVPESTGIELPLPVRPSFTFTGWVDANNNPVGTDGDTYTPIINETLTATWVQDSRFGVNPANLSDLLDTTLNGQGIDTTITQGDISVRIVVPQEAFSQEVAIDMDLFTNNDLQDSLLGSENNYVLSVLLSWISGTGRNATVPNTDLDHPIVLTISDPDIKAGARIYKVIGTRIEDLGVATEDGEITVDIFEDPSIVVAATKPDQVVISSVSAADEQATISWSAPSNGGSAITGYTVTSNLGDSCSVVVTTCNITGLTNGVSYTFTVTATNSVGTSNPSAVSTSVIPSFVTYPVVFDSNGGSAVANTTYPRTGSITKPADPVLLGYAFAGWSTVLDDESSVVDFTGGSHDPSVDEAKTFYALWSANDDTVTFKANFEGEDDVTQVITTDTETALTKNSFIRSGYRFLGWAESETGEMVYEDEELVTIKEPMTLWAVWSRNSSPAEETFEAEEVISKPDYSESGGARPGETIEFEIAGGQRVISATVADIEVEFRTTAAGFEITVPESLAPGQYDLTVVIDGNEQVFENYVVILSTSQPQTRFWTKRISDTEAKVYIKYVGLDRQYSIGHQTAGVGEYDPLTTITAETFEDDRLRFAIGAYYIVRTITLEPGINRINVYVDGEQQELRGRMDPVRYTR